MILVISHESVEKPINVQDKIILLESFCDPSYKNEKYLSVIITCNGTLSIIIIKSILNYSYGYLHVRKEGNIKM